MRTSASVLLVAAVLLGSTGARAETRLGAFAGPAVFAREGRLGASHIGPAAGLAVDFSLTESLGLSFRPGYYEKGGSGWDVAITAGLGASWGDLDRALTESAMTVVGAESPPYRGVVGVTFDLI